MLAGVQGALVPRLDWAPRRLLLLGVPLAAVGLAGLAVAPGPWALAAAMLVVAAGMAVASPGYVAGSTLAVADGEQPALAGLVTATNGLAFVAGPRSAACCTAWPTSRRSCWPRWSPCSGSSCCSGTGEPRPG